MFTKHTIVVLAEVLFRWLSGVAFDTDWGGRNVYVAVPLLVASFTSSSTFHSFSRPFLSSTVFLLLQNIPLLLQNVPLLHGKF